MAIGTMLQRSYSLFTVKSVDVEKRILTGIATTPTPDRAGDIVDPLGAKFAADLPLLLFHNHQMPVGRVRLGKATRQGIPFEAQIPEIHEPGTLRDRVDEAWQSVKAGLITGVSIGFRAFEDGVERLKNGGLRFTGFEILELSLVPIPANADATILAVKSLDAAHLAPSGNGAGTHTSAVAGTHATARKGARHMKKTYADQITDLTNKRAANEARLAEIQEKAAGEGRTKDEAEREEFDGLKAEIKGIDAELVDLKDLQAVVVSRAQAVAGSTQAEAAASRGGSVEAKSVQVGGENVEKGIGYARAVMCQLDARLNGYGVSALEVAKARYPYHQSLHNFLQHKATVPAGTTTQAVWASPLVYAQNLASEFVEFLRPQTILGKFGTGGVPGLTAVPFNVRVPTQTSGGHAAWVGEGAGKPVTSMAFSYVTLPYHKIATIAVLTKELVRHSNPSAELYVRNTLAGAIVEQLDRDFIDPATSAVSGVNPASITNGLTAMTSAGTSADNARTDIASIVNSFIADNKNTTGLVFIMPPTMALVLSLMRNSLGQKEFADIGPNGGSLEGIPVITSQLAANASGGGNLVIAVKAPEIFLADDGVVSIDASQEASVQMSDAPTVNSSTGTGASLVSLWQTNSVGIRAEREITWAKARSTAVVYMDDVNWGSVGSPE